MIRVKLLTRQISTSVNVNPAAHPSISIFNYIPADSVAFLAGSDLKSMGLSVLDLLQKSNPEMADFAQKAFSDNLGVNLARRYRAMDERRLLFQHAADIGDIFLYPHLPLPS